MKNIDIAFQHGWGFDASIWDEWLELISKATLTTSKIIVGSRGYFYEPIQIVSFESHNTVKVLITHSLGLHLIPTSVLSNLDLLVIISGFQHFHSYIEKNALQSKRIIKHMKGKLVSSAQDVLTDFHRNCFAPLLKDPDTVPKINIQKLLADLELLDNHVYPLELLTKVPSILLLHGARDTIVPIDRSIKLHKLLPNSTLDIAKSQGHSLPFTATTWCWNRVLKNIDLSRKESFELSGRVL